MIVGKIETMLKNVIMLFRDKENYVSQRQRERENRVGAIFEKIMAIIMQKV